MSCSLMKNSKPGLWSSRKWQPLMLKKVASLTATWWISLNGSSHRQIIQDFLKIDVVWLKAFDCHKIQTVYPCTLWVQLHHLSSLIIIIHHIFLLRRTILWIDSNLCLVMDLKAFQLRRQTPCFIFFISLTIKESLVCSSKSWK